MSRYALMLVVALVGCTKPQTKDKPLSEAEVRDIVNLVPDEYAPLLAAKYHIAPEVAHAIISDYKVHQMLSGLTTTPTPSTETMQQTIERLSRTHNVPPDVVASLIVDQLQLTRAD